ncbi:hypothetical protein NXF25_015060 [Crotalus adamanteus]|uniref:Integrase catalytic domain-containing protein n=1 Tax=Crotalus adamanteus TaxID=8729 RepID=A0AAW1AXK1_CROAD
MIRHATSAPFHPSTNGMAERMVRITKDALKRLTYGDWHHRVTGPLSYEVALDNGRVLRRHIDQLRPRRDLSDETPGSFPGGEGDPLEQREGHELLPISTDGATDGPFQASASAPKRNSWSLPTQQAFTPTPARESPRGHTHCPHTSHSTPVTEDTREHPNKSFPARELAHNPQSWPDLTPNPTGGQTYREVVEEPSPDRNTSSPNQGVTEFWEGTETHTSPDTERGLGMGQPPDRSWTDLGGSIETPSSGYHFKGPEGLQLGRSTRSQSDRSPGLTSPAVPGRCKAARDQTGCRQRRAHARVLAREKYRIDPGNVYIRSWEGVRRLQLVQNAAARAIVGTQRCAHVSPILRELHWLPVGLRTQFKVLVITFKALHGIGPGYLQDRILPHSSQRPVRSHRLGLLQVPSARQCRLAGPRGRAFSVVAPTWWNQLPPEVRTTPTLPAFKKAVKTLLFRQAWG